MEKQLKFDQRSNTLEQRVSSTVFRMSLTPFIQTLV